MNKQAVTDTDYKRLSALLEAVRRGKKPERASHLESSLRSALLFSDNAVSRFVTMGSIVDIRGQADGERYTYQLVFPADADIALGRVSVLSPLGAALLGRKEGERFCYDSPGGDVEVLIEGIKAAAEEAVDVP